MSDPASGQYQICRADGSSPLTYGRGAGSIQVESTLPDPGTINVQDASVVGHDGLLFGVDTMPGMVITQTGYALTTPATGHSALDAYSRLAAAWNDPAVRLGSNSVQILRAWYPGSLVMRRCYGRGRKIIPALGAVFQGSVPFTAQFQCADGNWYDDAQSSVLITIASRSGLKPITPLRTPGSLAPANLSSRATVLCSGDLPTWPVFTVNGPVENPRITYRDTPVTIGYTGRITDAQSLVIDTRPWNRTFRLSGASAAGGIYGSAMIAMQLQPGATVVQYEGTDYVGSAGSTCTVAWRNSWQSIGGSQ